MIVRFPVLCFFLLAYLITWPFHILGMILADRAGTSISNEDNYRSFTDLIRLEISSDQLVPYLLFNFGQFGPALSAFLLTAIIYGRIGLRDLTTRVLRWQVGLRWYGIDLLLPLVLVGAGLGLAFLVDGFKLGPFTPELAWIAFVPFFLYSLVFNGLAEEPGWRGFALPHLQAQTNAYRASWMLGIGWGLWHVPFTIYFNRDEPVLLIPSFIGLTVGVVGWTIVNTWVYNSTQSVWLIMLLHGWSNTVQSYFILSQPNFLAQSVFLLLPWAMAYVLERRYGREDLAAAPRPQWWPGRYRVEQRGEAERPALAA